ncbi:hypothetical protein GCM10009115_32980 [Sphingopyxis soli]|uniref:Uncharacterized protein n=1 Tax=Sphingopyxis soli TaxID=592051 RepID=A0ABN1MCC2_9SPHN
MQPWEGLRAAISPSLRNREARFQKPVTPDLIRGPAFLQMSGTLGRARGDEVSMTEKKKPPPPIPLCRFEELAERENRLREEAARGPKKPDPKPR